MPEMVMDGGTMLSWFEMKDKRLEVVMDGGHNARDGDTILEMVRDGHTMLQLVMNGGTMLEMVRVWGHNA